VTTEPRPFAQVDVFSARPGFGNPVAVVLDGRGLDDDAMQRFARWTNLSETTFVLPPTDPRADYALRIFTPGGELPFAGHPTLGSCFAWLAAGGVPKSAGRIVQQCAKGWIDIRQDGARLAFAAPPMQASDPAPGSVDPITQALGLAPAQVRRTQILDNDPRFFTLLLDSADTVRALKPDLLRLAALEQNAAVAGLYRAIDAASAEPLIEVRVFVPLMGVPEDPVTGSLNASLAQWLIAAGDLPARYVAAQGAALGRAGRVHVERDAQSQVWIGGDCVTVVRGEVTL
jgi:PhzF family phenazine biosynthesis protein